MNGILQVQPEWCRKPLPYKKGLIVEEPYLERLMSYDPTVLYDRIQEKIDPFKRYNFINFVELFPPQSIICACGCGKKTDSIYYDRHCQFFAISVWEIIGGRQPFLEEIFKLYNGNDLCVNCNERKFKEIDHLYPVSKGGGGCWLSNFQPLCKKCHTEKTRNDFGWEKLKTSKNYDQEH